MVKYLLLLSVLCLVILSCDKTSEPENLLPTPVIYEDVNANLSSSHNTIKNNNFSPLKIVFPPVFYPAQGNYLIPQTITMSCQTPRSIIRYTTDGSEPSITSLPYIYPITIYESTAFKAKAFKSGGHISQTTTAFYDIIVVHEQLITVQGGTFIMGCTNGSGDNDEYPLHQVTLSTFYISEHEVTQGEYISVMNANPSTFPTSPMHPVDNVSFYNAVEYCNKRSFRENLMPCYEYLDLGYDVSDWPTYWNEANHNNIICHFDNNGYRLPTEAEWEYAAKGGHFSQNYYYSGSNVLDLVGWWGGNSNNQTHAVCTKLPNELGIFDMTGNAWEIIWDWYGLFSAGAVTNPTGPATGSYRVFRGGMWQAPSEIQRVSNRSSAPPINHAGSYGFRVVRSSVQN